jgi:hypothetical protein
MQCFNFSYDKISTSVNLTNYFDKFLGKKITNVLYHKLEKSPNLVWTGISITGIQKIQKLY